MDALFKTRAGSVSLPILEERALIAQAQAGDGDATWALLVQYRGILQKTAWNVRKAVRSLTPEQIEDLEADLVLAAVETVKTFDLERFTRLSQVLPGRLRDVALQMSTALAVPRGTLALWFKVWRAAEHDFHAAEELAPRMGMSTNTFRAIAHGLAHAGSEWVVVPFSALVPTADEETYRLAHHALDTLTPAERDVIELAYGFRGDPKSDAETAMVLVSTRATVTHRRQRALAKMRSTLTEKSSETG